MKKVKKSIVLPIKSAKQVQYILLQYQSLNEYVLRKLTKRELISTNQIVEKYFVSRHTVYRLTKLKHLEAIIKYRTLYFDAEDTEEFFANYWRRLE